ncbi:MAG: acyl-CoA/acyl-ACP dehydrogenase [Proteobacteria bacterium]|nr:acyl-CoA/acyl-ACP dehydrogenase [Pseudomonadota bacterium]
MNFAFTEEQEALRSAARSFLADHSGSEQVRAAMASELGHDPQVWKQIAAELGWTAVIIPEAYGGLGLGFVELVALQEVMGEALFCAPFFSSVCLGANALLVAGSEEQKRALLPGIAEGETRATLAFAEPNGRWDASGIECVARPGAGGGFALDGTKSFAVDGYRADLLVVAARREGSTGEDGIGLFALAGDTPGLTRRALPTLDPTRPLAEIALRDARVPAAALLGDNLDAAPALRKILARAAVALSAELVGVAQKCLDLSVDYAKERVQFGRPIGSFQAIKHKCADMMVAVESARSASYYAGCVAAEDSDELLVTASLAKATCSEAAFRCAADAIQIHGGVGFTWEYDVHLYFKRARAGEHLLGDPAFHRERVARAIGL